MATLFKWRIFCTTDNQFEIIWDTDTPSVCPVNAGHSVNIDSVHFTERVTTYKIINGTSIAEGFNVYRLETVNSNVQLTLPATGDNVNRVLIIQRLTTNGNTATLLPNSSTETINNTTSYSLTNDKETVKLIPNGKNWDLLDIKTRTGEKDNQLEANVFIGITQETSYNYTEINTTPNVIARYVCCGYNRISWKFCMGFTSWKWNYSKSGHTK